MTEPIPDPDDGHADTVDESDYADPGDFPDADDEEEPQ
jgi:hypothetical protein